MIEKKIRRNDPCPCGSGKRYKQCCGSTAEAPQAHNPLPRDFQTALEHHQAGRLSQAELLYKKIIQESPGHTDVPHFHRNLGDVRLALGKLDAAVGSYHQALLLKPDYADAYLNQGAALHSQGKFDAAVENFGKAIALAPDNPVARNNLALTLQEQAKLDEAVMNYQQALVLKPDYIKAHSNLLFTLSYHSRCSPDEYLEEARRYGEKVLARAKPYTRWQISPAEQASQSTQSLRVGLVSGDFRTHPVAFFLERVLACLDPARIELVAYSTNRQEDELTARIKPRFAAWNTLEGMNDETAAQKIHGDGIHILIDLAGHTGRTSDKRLPLFAWKPAPVQVSWLGYFASTGVPGMDYLLADPISVPASHQSHFTEMVWHLPDSRLCFTPPAESANTLRTPLPAMRNGHIIFGCFQSLPKVNEGVLSVWARIFRALPQARLRLQNKQMSCPASREHLLQRLTQAGIAPEQVTLEQPTNREAYLAAHAEVDIILDTFPYPGGTTTCEALWMGVPTLTLAGNTLLSRQGASLLACAGLPDWIARDENDYVTRALAHATDINRLAHLRSTLRAQMLASPLCDAPRFALNLEKALQGMWQAYCTKAV